MNSESGYENIPGTDKPFPDSVYKAGLPYEQYWQILKDSLKFSLTDNKNTHLILDTTKEFKIIYGHFTSVDYPELLLQRLFFKIRGDSLLVACLFSFKNNGWKFNRIIYKDTINYIDLDKDSIYELFCKEVYAGCGSIGIHSSIISLKNNITRYLFENLSIDNRNSVYSLTSKSGDTIVDVASYNFYDTVKNGPLILKETKQIGIKKGYLKNKDRVILSFSTIEKNYKLENGQYK